MPREAMEAPKGIELLEELSLGVVMRTYPRHLVESVLDELGRNSVRRRSLPAFLVVYLVIALALNRHVSVRETLRILLDSLRQKFGLHRVPVVVGSAISKARQRLGPEPFEVLFDRVVQPVADASLKQTHWNELRIVAVDGSRTEVQDTVQNREHFGVHRNQHGPVGYPQVKWVALYECGTRVAFAASLGGTHDSEVSLFDNLADELSEDMLLLADRGFYSFDRWRRCARICGALLWRIKTNINLRAVEELPDGSWIAEVRPSNRLVRQGRAERTDRNVMRVVDYQAVFEDESVGEHIRLVSTVLDPDEAPASELARIYAERWRSETGFDEIKTHLKGAGRILRSQRPELVIQEFYGFLLAYYVVRSVMAEAARKEGIPPSDLSFVHSVRVIRRRLSSGFSPSAP